MKTKAFSFIRLLVVIAIVAFLTCVVVGALGGCSVVVDSVTIDLGGQ